MRNVYTYIEYLKSKRPYRWRFLSEAANRIRTTSTIDDVKSVYDYITRIFKNEPEEIDTFNVLVWDKLEFKIMF